jgi:hypothetical protein
MRTVPQARSQASALAWRFGLGVEGTGVRAKARVPANQAVTETQVQNFMKMAALRQSPISTVARCILVVSLLAPSSAWPAEDSSPCEQIAAACKAAGFTPGGVNTGTGLLVHCVNPILQGTAQPSQAQRPLPHIDSRLVAACKASIPHGGQAQTSAEQPATAASSGSISHDLVTLPPSVQSQLDALERTVATLTTETNSLESRVKKLEGEDLAINARTDYRCDGKNQYGQFASSVNGSGVKQSCSPYLCQPISGRCAPQNCDSVKECLAPYVCNASGQCITPP